MTHTVKTSSMAGIFNADKILGSPNFMSYVMLQPITKELKSTSKNTKLRG